MIATQGTRQVAHIVRQSQSVILERKLSRLDSDVGGNAHVLAVEQDPESPDGSN